MATSEGSGGPRNITEPEMKHYINPASAIEAEMRYQQYKKNEERRERIATAAMQALLSTLTGTMSLNIERPSIEYISSLAVSLADILISELDKKPNNA